MTSPTDNAMLASRAASAIAITPMTMAKELEAARAKIGGGLRRLAEISEDDLAIATVPRDEVWREDMRSRVTQGYAARERRRWSR